jgi:hypothetical protein
MNLRTRARTCFAGALALAFFAACSSDKISASPHSSPNVDGGLTSEGDASTGGGTGGGGLISTGDASFDDGSAPSFALTITPADPVLEVTVVDGVVTSSMISTGGASLTFQASASGTPTTASWSIDKGDIGSIDAATGAFTPSGNVAGTAKITATAGTGRGTTTVTVHVHSIQNGKPATNMVPVGLGGYGGVGGEGLGDAVDNTTQGRLKNESTTPSIQELSLLYPYDKTVWPRGILAPLLMWNTNKTLTAVYIHLKENGYEFEGYYGKPAAAAQFIRHPIEQSAWAHALSSNTGDALHLDIKVFDGTKVYGPISRDWTVASGILRGSIYYNSYQTKLNDPINTKQQAAATLVIKSGATEPALAFANEKGRCIVCHTVSDDGSTLFVQEGFDNGASGLDYNTGFSYDLTKGGTQIAQYQGTVAAGDVRKFTWSASWRDGSFAMQSGTDLYGMASGDYTFWFTQGGSQGAPPTDVNVRSKLWRRDNGAQMTPVTGLGGIDVVVTPAFNRDGTKIGFNYWTGTAGAGGGKGKTLDVMDFACGAPMTPATPGGPACASYTFSNLRRVYTNPDNLVGWPGWLPDSSGMIFQQRLSAGGADYWCAGMQTWRGCKGELWFVTVPDDAATTPKPVRLDQTNGAGYLPTANNHADDNRMNYEPTVNPIASGGFYWIVFTSRRMYGNIAQGDPYEVGDATHPVPKKLWVAAIDQHPKDNVDPSHPAFYLPGQELDAPNMRGFWVVDPCKSDGNACETGDECCGGFCRPGDKGGLVCGQKPMGCANEFERCAASSDCCGYDPKGGGFECINGFCVQPPPNVK